MLEPESYDFEQFRVLIEIILEERLKKKTNVSKALSEAVEKGYVIKIGDTNFQWKNGKFKVISDSE